MSESLGSSTEPRPKWRLARAAVRVTGSLNASEFSGVAVPILIACFPLVWMALSRRVFYDDWLNHLWMIGYTGEYFRHHLTFPSVLNTDQAVGVAFPMFYGTLFYPLAGIISALTGAGVAMRVVLVATSWLQTVSVIRLVRAVYPDRSERCVSWCVAAVVSFGTYPLTNLYNRSAITEYVAVSLLVSACSVWLRFIYSGDRPRAWISASFAWLLLVLSAGTHPITALLGSMFFGALLLASFIGSANRLVTARLVVVHAALFAVVLSPWLYLMSKFYKDLSIVNQGSSSITVFADSIDLIWSRILPIPFDITPLLPVPLSTISTPYLDAQVNFGLLVIVCFLFYLALKGVRNWKTLATFEMMAAAVCAVSFVLLLLISVSPEICSQLPRSATIIQFSYRLVTYCDLSLLGAAVFLLRTLRNSSAKIKTFVRVCVAISVTLMTQCVFVKFNHAAAIQQRTELAGTGLSDDRDELRKVPSSFYGLDNYVVPRGFGGMVPTVASVVLPTRGGGEFGKVQSVPVERAGEFVTNIQAFPWNHVVLNGRSLPQAATYISAGDRLVARSTSRDSRVGYEFTPEAAYVVLRKVSGLVLLSWAGFLFLATVADRRVRASAPAGIPPEGSVFAGVLRRAAYAGLTLVVMAGVAGVLHGLEPLAVIDLSNPRIKPTKVSTRAGSDGACATPEVFVPTDRHPRLVSPAAGTVLTSSPATFVWTAVPRAVDYWIDIGTEPRKGNVFGGLTGGVRSKTIDIGSLLTGRTLYVQLFAKFPHVNLTPGTGNNYAFATGVQ